MFELRGLDGAPDRHILTICDPPVYVWSEYKSSTVTTADSQHHFMHFKYTLRDVNEEFAGEAVTERFSPIVEFDIGEAICLNWSGTLELTGGSPVDTYNIAFHWAKPKHSKRKRKKPQLHWHHLTGYLPNGTRYELPLYHRQMWFVPSIGSLIPGAMVYSPLNPARMQVVPMPITGTRIVTVSQDCYIVSRVRL